MSDNHAYTKQRRKTVQRQAEEGDLYLAKCGCSWVFHEGMGWRQVVSCEGRAQPKATPISNEV